MKQSDKDFKMCILRLLGGINLHCNTKIGTKKIGTNETFGYK